MKDAVFWFLLSFAVLLNLVNFLNHYYHKIFQEAPVSILKLIDVSYKHHIPILIFLILMIIALIFKQSTLDFRKRHISNNLGNEFFESFQSFLNALVKKNDIALKQKLTESKPELFSDYFDFDEIRVGSINGKQLDYFSVVYPLDIDPFCSFFYIGKTTSKRNAIKILSDQGFDYCGKEKNTIHFSKGNKHLRFVYKPLTIGILGIEFCDESIESDIEERVDEKYSLINKNILNEIKVSAKEFASMPPKEKFYLFLAFILAIVICITISFVLLKLIQGI